MSDGKGLVRLFMGGSFNPITIAHLRVLELARDYVHRNLGLKVESAVISPVGDHYKEKPLQPASIRVEMCRLATQTLPTSWIKVDDWESKQDKWVRTRANLERQQLLVNDEYGRRMSIEIEEDGSDPDPGEVRATVIPRIMLVCGTDLVSSFEKPGLWQIEDLEVILRNYGILCITRKGTQEIYKNVVPEELRGLIEPQKESPFCGIHEVEEWAPNEISSTKVRMGLRNGLTVQGLVPDAVLTYIRERHLYEPEPM
jgi:nicotinamide mononucleotide adenylyltransferase